MRVLTVYVVFVLSVLAGCAGVQSRPLAQTPKETPVTYTTTSLTENVVSVRIWRQTGNLNQEVTASFPEPTTLYRGVCGNSLESMHNCLFWHDGKKETHQLNLQDGWQVIDLQVFQEPEPIRFY